MRQRFARRAFLLVAVLLAPALGHAQTRDQIRARDAQLYQQYQENGSAVAPGDGGATAPVAPSYGGGSDATADVGAGAGGGVGPSGGNLTAQLLDRVSALESEVRTLRGRVDELEQQQQTSTAALNKQIGDLSFQLQQGAGAHGAASAPDGGVPPAAEARPAAAPPPARITPEASLREGDAALARHDYDAAASDAQAALHGPHAADAQYLLGSAYAGQHNYQQAAVAFYGAYSHNPRGPVAPGALLRVGSSMAAAGQTGAACEALGKLRAEFPALRGGVVTSAAALRRRLHC